MNRKNIVKTGLIVLILASLTLLTSCMSSGENETITSEELHNTLWLSPLCGMPGEGSFGKEGFFLADDGSLLFVNIFSMTGDSWSLEENILTLNSHTERYPEPSSVDYPIRMVDGVAGIIPVEEELEILPPTAVEITASIPEGRWFIANILNPDNAAADSVEPAYIDIAKDGEGLVMISGNGGVNNFRGSLDLEGFLWKSGPYMRTLMAGPGLAYEDLLMNTLDRVSRFLLVEDYLFLYEGTELILVLNKPEA